MSSTQSQILISARRQTVELWQRKTQKTALEELLRNAIEHRPKSTRHNVSSSSSPWWQCSAVTASKHCERIVSVNTVESWIELANSWHPIRTRSWKDPANCPSNTGSTTSSTTPGFPRTIMLQDRDTVENVTANDRRGQKTIWLTWEKLTLDATHGTTADKTPTDDVTLKKQWNDATDNNEDLWRILDLDREGGVEPVSTPDVIRPDPRRQPHYEDRDDRTRPKTVAENDHGDLNGSHKRSPEPAQRRRMTPQPLGGLAQRQVCSTWWQHTNMPMKCLQQ